MKKKASIDRSANATPTSAGPSPSPSTTSLASNPEEVAEKELIEEYLQQHGLENALNVFLNQVVRDRPSDPYLVLGSLLQNRATTSKGIFTISAREIIDGNGFPTILASVFTAKGRFDASTSSYTPTVYDTDEPTRFRGKGVRARDLALYMQHLLEGVDPCEQEKCDEKIATMEEKLGRQTCLALSMAICKAGAVHKDCPLFEYIALLADMPIESACIPVPHFSVLHGGLLASNKVYMQEVTVAPLTCTTIQDAIRWGTEFQLLLQTALDAKGLGHSNRGAFGGFAPLLNTNDEAWIIIQDTIKKFTEAFPAAPPLGVGVHLAAHAFANPPTDNGDCVYNLDKWAIGSKGLMKSGEELMEIQREWCRQYNLMTIVDPVDVRDIKVASTLTRNENDVAGATTPREPIGGDATVRVQIVGHTLLQVGVEKIHEERACNTILLHLSHFTTVTALMKAVIQARTLGLSIIVGCDPGSTDDVFPVDLAVGIGCGQVKMGGLFASDCASRYNRLASFVDDPRAPPYAGPNFRR